MNPSMVNGILDNDLYKFSMAQLVYHFFSDYNVEYAFKCRNKVEWTKEHVDSIREQVNDFLPQMRLSPEEKEYLLSLRYLKRGFVEFVSQFRFDPKYVDIKLVNGELGIRITGPWLQTIFFEVPLLAIVNQSYYGTEIITDTNKNYLAGMQRLDEKIEKINRYKIFLAEMGTRRRWNGYFQKSVARRLAASCPTFIGTSNVGLAKDIGVPAIGTMAHEYIMSGAGCKDTSLLNSQRYMLQKWVEEYRGDLGIALTDTYGIDFFLNDFDLYFAKLYDGLRHDSGCPFEWGEKVIRKYDKLGIDPMTKKLIFTDGLDIDTAARIRDHFQGRANTFYGIGTHLTNDVGLDALKIVIKMVCCNGMPTIKLPDSSGKTMCEDEWFRDYATYLFRTHIFNMSQ